MSKRTLPVPHTAAAAACVPCLKCDETFHTTLAMNMHRCREEPWLPCYLCGQAYFRTRLQLQEHLLHSCIRRGTVSKAATEPSQLREHLLHSYIRHMRKRKPETTVDDCRPSKWSRAMLEDDLLLSDTSVDLTEEEEEEEEEEESPGDDEMSIVETALSGYAKTYQLSCGESCVNATAVEQFLRGSIPALERTLRRELVTAQGLKYTLWFEAVYTNPTGETSEPRNFKTSSVTLFHTTSYEEIRRHLNENIRKILSEIEEHEGRGSGWTLYSLRHLQLRLSKCSFYRTSPRRYVKLPKEITNRKACLNVVNQDDFCFKYAIISKAYSGSKTEITVDEVNQIEHEYNFYNIAFPVSPNEINKFERQNADTSVNVFTLDGQNKIAPLKIVDVEKNDHFDLLLISNSDNKHYVLIKDFEKLIRKQLVKNRNRITICKRCFTFKRNTRLGRRNTASPQSWLNEHKQHCNTFKPAEMILPKEGEEDSTMYFKNRSHHLRIPITIFCDLESTLSPISSCEKDPEKSRTRQTQLHEVNSFAFLVKSYLPQDMLTKYQIPTDVQLCREENAAYKLMSRLKQLAQNVGNLYKQNVPMKPLTVEEQNRHDSSTECKFCSSVYSETVVKVKDHDHLTGAYRNDYCQECNLNFQVPTFIPVFFHNLMGYDSNFLIRILGFFNCRISIIPSTSEKFISFSVFVNGIELRFLDSLKFTLCSLDNLVKSMPSDQLIETRRMVQDAEKFKLCLKKGVYFYDYIDNIEKFNETRLPEKKNFYNRLSDSHITDEEYGHAQLVWKTFNFQTLGDYHDHYLRLDVTLLTDAMEAFRDVCYREYKLDPFHSYTAPGLSWNAMLLKTGVKLDLITDYDQYLFVESAMRGGYVASNLKHAKANNPWLENPDDYDSSQDTSHIMYFDATNLYGTVMQMSLPTGGFEWVSKPEKINYRDIPADSPIGYLIEADISYGEELHDAHNDFPLLPAKRIPPNGKTPKLLATLEDKTSYVAHHSIIAQAEEQGLKIVKIRRALQFNQSPWLKSYVELNTRLRQNARNDFEKAIWKLMTNSVYGKCSENLRTRINIKLVTTEAEFLKETSKVNYLDRTIISENLVAVHLNKHRIKLNRPLYVGQCVLDLAKHYMYNFHYNVMCKHFHVIYLIYTDTDSLIYLIVTSDLFGKLEKLAKYFDFSSYPKDHPLYKAQLPENTKKIGTFKDEASGRQIQEQIGLKAKMYAFRFRSDACRLSRDVEMKAKGVKSSALKNQVLFEHYKRALFKNETFHTRFNVIRSRNHCVYTENVQKISLSSTDDKRHILEDGIHTLAWGHCRLKNKKQS